MKSKIEDYLITEKKYSKRDIYRIVEDAGMDFWARVAEMVPEATSGDSDPGDIDKLEKAMAKAISSWIDYNVPQ